ncbi:MAG: flavodoxin [Bacteroidales bacterium]|nr:flavodoxin [Bacteroidales bacterium]
MAAVSAGLVLSACSGNKESEKTAADSVAPTSTEADGTKVLVAYYSATGTTAKAAEEIAKATGGTLYEIEPEQKYSDEDLDYENDNSRSSVENKNPDMRPAIKKGLDVAPYQTIYLGFPVWWDKAPLVVNTFLDSYDFTGKNIVVFATAHSSGLTPSFEALKATYPSLDLTEGKILNNTSEESFHEWVKGL